MPLVVISGPGSRYYASAGADTTAPTLSSAVGTETGATTATVGATTDEANGTLYVVVTTSATQPSIAQIKAGDDHTGANAVYASSQAISSTGAKTFNATGLTAETTYYAHLVHTDAAANDSSRISSASFTTDAAGAGVFFQPNVETATTVAEMFLNDVNTYDGGTAALVTDPNPRAGTTKSVRLRYPNDEAGVELQPLAFTNTTSLFARHYVRFATGWAGNWPVGCKTSRFFSRSDFSTGSAEPNASAYISEKLIWQTYGGDPDDLYGRGYNNAIFNLDLEGTYGAGVNFANGLPYIREDTWYKWERWYVINSAPDVADGVMQIWVDDELICNRSNVAYRSTIRGCPNGTGWQSMWFGGNYSGASFGHPGINLDRYENGFYLSTTLDR